MEKVDEKDKKLLFKEFGNYCLDMSKLVFGGVILAGIMELDVSNVLLFGVGAAIVLLSAVTGFVFLKLSN